MHPLSTCFRRSKYLPQRLRCRRPFPQGGLRIHRSWRAHGVAQRVSSSGLSGLHSGFPPLDDVSDVRSKKRKARDASSSSDSSSSSSRRKRKEKKRLKKQKKAAKESKMQKATESKAQRAEDQLQKKHDAENAKAANKVRALAEKHARQLVSDSTKSMLKLSTMKNTIAMTLAHPKADSYKKLEHIASLKRYAEDVEGWLTACMDRISGKTTIALPFTLEKLAADSATVSVQSKKAAAFFKTL